MTGAPDLGTLGSYEVRFTSAYRGMNLSERRIVNVVDTLPPTIDLVSDPNHYTNPSAGYEEEGFSATDIHDGDVTSLVNREEHDGVVTYSVTDSSGNTTSIERKIICKDTIAPVITLKSGDHISLNKGNDFADPGYTAADECDGDLTNSVTVEGTVDGHTYGTYTLTYRVSDSSRSLAEATRTVTIADLEAPIITLGDENCIYIKVGTDYADPTPMIHFTAKN